MCVRARRQRNFELEADKLRFKIAKVELEHAQIILGEKRRREITNKTILERGAKGYVV
jgi:hypothetical protein